MNHLEQPTPAEQSSIDLDLPLDDDTDDGDAVAALVQQILTGIDDLAADGAVSGRDAVQALSIATAVQAAKAEVSERSGQRLALNLIDVRLREERLN
jgi:hypothetical protein